MEFEADVRRLYSFHSHLTEKEIVLLKTHQEALHTHDVSKEDHIHINVDAGGQSFLATVSKEKAFRLANFYEHCAAQYVQLGGTIQWLPSAALGLATRFCCEALGFTHTKTVNIINQLAASLEREGQLTKALPLYRFVYEFCDKTLGAQHKNTSFAITNVADCLAGLGQHSDALPLRRRELELFRALPSDEASLLEVGLVDLAECLSKLGLIDEELLLRQELFEHRTSRLSDHDEATLDAIHNLGACHSRARHPAEALELFQKEFNGWMAREETPPNRKILTVTNAIGKCFLTLEQFNEAFFAFVKTVAIAETAGMEDDLLVNEAKELRTKSLLRWSNIATKMINEFDHNAYMNCMEQFTNGKFEEFLVCALPMINTFHTNTMLLTVLISLQRIGEESILRDIVSQLYVTLKDPWLRSLTRLTLGLEESSTVQAVAQGNDQSAQAHYYTGCRLLTLGRVKEARKEFEMAMVQQAGNEECFFSSKELGPYGMSISTANDAARLVDGDTWAQAWPAQKENDGSNAEELPFTVSEVMDQLIKEGIPREEWEQVVDELNANGRAIFTAHEYQGIPLKKGTRLKYSLKRIATVTGPAYLGMVTLPVQDTIRQQQSKPITERLFSNKDGLPASNPSGLVADDEQAWVSYQNGKLFRIDSKTGTVEALPAEKRHQHDEIMSLHLSRRFLWVGSDMGVSRFDVKDGTWKTYGFSAGSIKAIREDGDSLWALSDSQLVQLDWPREELRGISLPVNGDSRALVVVDGEVWCGFDEERNTLFRFGIRDEIWSRVATFPYVLSLHHKPVWCGEGDLWVGTCMGVQVVDRNLVSAKDFGMRELGMIHSITDVGGLIAFGTKWGLIGFDSIKTMMTKKIQIEPLRFTGQHVTEVCGAEEIVWAVVPGEGVACLPLEALRDI